MINMNLLGMFSLFKLELKRQLTYPFHFFIWATLWPIFIIINYFLWQSVYAFSGQTVIRGMTFESLIAYFIAAMVIGFATEANFDSWIATRIRSGKLLTQISLPMSFMHYLFSYWISKKVINVIIYSIPVFALAYLFVGFNIFKTNALLLLFSIVVAGLLTFSFTMLFAMTAFWFKDIRGVTHLRQGILWFMSGAVLPLNFFPEWFQEISMYLPFQYMRYIPAKVMTGEINSFSAFMFAQIFWAVAMFLLAAYIWKYAYRQFTGAGA